ncbi:MAG TPA: SPASM domain-containing protein, partial [Phycisphaerae bacterium]|nr:SPASM domain-containing protein [Phycisphaerae bacterium]
PQYIRKAGEIGCLTHLNTNGSLLTEEMVEHLMKAGLDSIKFSFQGVDRKSFREMRNRDFFDELLARVKRLYDRRGDGHKPYIHVSTTITYETPEQVRAFRNRVAPFADLVTVGHTALEHIVPEKTRLSEADKATLRVLKEKESVLRVHPECPEVYDKLSVNWDGTVSACCADYDDQMLVGDIRTETLADIWKCPKLNAYRKLLAEMRHDELPVCRLCWDYSGLKHPGGTRKT